MWTEDEINFLVNNYPSKGGDYCVEQLNKTKSQIRYKVSMLGLKVDKSVLIDNSSRQAKLRNDNRPDTDFKVDVGKFKSITEPEVAYFLGLFWADGYLYKHSIEIYCATEDIKNIKPSLDVVGEWNYYNNEARKEGWKPITRVHTNNKRITNILVECDYDKKSTYSADKILDRIPEELRNYFFRGLIDGDGCFYIGKNKEGRITQRQLTMTSTYEQDWGYYINLLDSMDIKYSVRRVENKNGNRYSQVRITNKKGIIKLGEYLYRGKLFGFDRKYEKFKLMV